MDGEEMLLCFACVNGNRNGVKSRQELFGGTFVFYIKVRYFMLTNPLNKEYFEFNQLS